MVKVIVEGPNKKSSVGTRMNYVFSRVPARPGPTTESPGPAWPGISPGPARPGPEPVARPLTRPGPDLKKPARSSLFKVTL